MILSHSQNSQSLWFWSSKTSMLYSRSSCTSHARTTWFPHQRISTFLQLRTNNGCVSDLITTQSLRTSVVCPSVSLHYPSSLSIIGRIKNQISPDSCDWSEPSPHLMQWRQCQFGPRVSRRFGPKGWHFSSPTDQRLTEQAGLLTSGEYQEISRNQGVQRFPFQRFPNVSKGFQRFPKNVQRFPNVSEGSKRFQRLPKVSKELLYHSLTNL